MKDFEEFWKVFHYPWFLRHCLQLRILLGWLFCWKPLRWIKYFFVNLIFPKISESIAVTILSSFEAGSCLCKVISFWIFPIIEPWLYTVLFLFNRIFFIKSSLSLTKKYYLIFSFILFNRNDLRFCLQNCCLNWLSV